MGDPQYEMIRRLLRSRAIAVGRASISLSAQVPLGHHARQAHRCVFFVARARFLGSELERLLHSQLFLIRSCESQRPCPWITRRRRVVPRHERLSPRCHVEATNEGGVDLATGYK